MSTEHNGQIIAEVRGLTVIRCDTCGFSHLHPIPSEDDVRALYATSYYETVKPSYFDDSERDADWWERVYEDRLELLRRISATVVHVGQDGERKNLLDIGSGTGRFLHHAAKLGWHGVGIEPSATAAQVSRNYFHEIAVHNGEFTEASVELLGKESQDAVHLSEVLEHVREPEKLLWNVWRVLRKSGVVCIVVPNDFNILQHGLQTAKTHEEWWVVPEHINYFNVYALRDLVRKCGFSVARVSATFPLELFIYMGMDYVGKPEVGAKIHGLRKTLETTMDAVPLLRGVRDDIYHHMGVHGLGRDLVLFAVKTL